MNLCDVYIEKIIEVRTYDNFVIAILDTDCWGCKQKGEKVVFSKEEWEKAKKGWQVSCLKRNGGGEHEREKI